MMPNAEFANSNADFAKLGVLMITSDIDAYTRLQASLANDYALKRLPDAENPLNIGLAGTKQDIILILREDVTTGYLEGWRDVIAETQTPVILFTDFDQDRLAPIAIRYGITSVVVAGFEPQRVPTLIEVSIERFKLYQGIRNELTKSQEELAARKVIERAKGLLMEKKQLNEQDAYRSLRELAMHQSKSIKEVAETLILYSDLLP